MGSIGNSNRSKRKYGDKRKSITESNRAVRTDRHMHSIERLVERTQELIGKKVTVRAPGGPEVGVVQEMIARPEGAKRAGTYLRIDTPTRKFTRTRSRIKVVD